MVVTWNTYNDSLSLRARIVNTCHFVPKILTTKKRHFFGPLFVLTVGQVVLQPIADRERHVVSVTDPQGRILDILDRFLVRIDEYIFTYV
jgi:hypothetical protein